jgi:glyoxylase-like metal-dependent hydrolase (beta-lactamase superfamily II)
VAARKLRNAPGDVDPSVHVDFGREQDVVSSREVVVCGVAGMPQVPGQFPVGGVQERRPLLVVLADEIIAIPEQRVIVADDGQEFSLAGRKLRCFFTEGHARHHYCLHDPASHGVFTGDSFGVSYREFDTAAGEFIFPTTTPVHFDPDEAHRSVDLVMARDPQQLFLTHYSRVTDLSRLAGDMHRGIDDFAGIAQRNIAVANRSAVIRDEMFEYLAERLQKHGSTADDARLHAILDMDTELNTMGLEHWLDHGSPS